MLKQKFILPVLGGVIIAGTAFGAGLVSAQTSASGSSTIVQKIAQKFGLNEAEVQAVFDEDLKARHDQMKAKFESRLSQDVAQGKITEAQKQLILQKHQEIQSQMTLDMENMTPEQMRTNMESKRAELESWASQNGIDLKYFHFGIKGHGKFMVGEFHKKIPPPQQ